MNIWLIVPVKALDEGKSRLTGALSPQERKELSVRLLQRVLSAAHAAGALAAVVVVSRDEEVLALARRQGAVALLEEANGLNEALDQGRRHAVAAGAEAVLVLPADLPLVTGDDIQLLVGQAENALVVAAASEDGGTNALLLRPPDALSFHFGADSFRRHVEMAQRAGLPVHVVESATLALDVDRPEDLTGLYALSGSGASA